MAEDFDLKKLTRDGLPAAIQRAEHYRLLNQPEQAESICLDILSVEADNQRALVVLILALTDQFSASGSGTAAKRARGHLNELNDAYERSYYAGIISEREARALLQRGPARSFAYDGMRAAMERYEQAATIRPPGNDDAILRWNACARTIQRADLQPRPQEVELGLE